MFKSFRQTGLMEYRFNDILYTAANAGEPVFGGTVEKNSTIMIYNLYSGIKSVKFSE